MTLWVMNMNGISGIAGFIQAGVSSGLNVLQAPQNQSGSASGKLMLVAAQFNRNQFRVEWGRDEGDLPFPFRRHWNDEEFWPPPVPVTQAINRSGSH